MFFKKTLKFLLIFILALLLFYLGAEAGYQIKYKIEQWKANKAAEAFNKAIVEMFKQDTYGGKTPEETFNLFVDALKNEDVDLAVKYIVLDPDRRARYWEEFDDLKTQGQLKKHVTSWPQWEDWEKAKKDENNDWENRAEVWFSRTTDKPMIIYDPYIRQEREVPPGEYLQYDIIFIKNTNNIWKIESL